MSDDDEPLGELADEVRSRTGDPDRDRERPPREGPLSDVAAEVDERRRRDRGPDPFESVDVDELDGEKLWEQLSRDGEPDTVAATVAPDADTEPSTDRDVRTIPKSTCHGCPHFGEPPELACTHEGTAILAMPDTEHFRVADCPMAVEDDDLGVIDADTDDE